MNEFTLLLFYECFEFDLIGVALERSGGQGSEPTGQIGQRQNRSNSCEANPSSISNIGKAGSPGIILLCINLDIPSLQSMHEF